MGFLLRDPAPFLRGLGFVQIPYPNFKWLKVMSNGIFRVNLFTPMMSTCFLGQLYLGVQGVSHRLHTYVHACAFIRFPDDSSLAPVELMGILICMQHCPFETRERTTFRNDLTQMRSLIASKDQMESLPPRMFLSFSHMSPLEFQLRSRCSLFIPKSVIRVSI